MSATPDDDWICTCGHFADQHANNVGACAGHYRPCSCQRFVYDERATVSNWSAEDATW